MADETCPVGVDGHCWDLVPMVSANGSGQKLHICCQCGATSWRAEKKHGNFYPGRQQTPQGMNRPMPSQDFRPMPTPVPIQQSNG